jgi:hypothetical protein
MQTEVVSCVLGGWIFPDACSSLPQVLCFALLLASEISGTLKWRQVYTANSSQRFCVHMYYGGSRYSQVSFCGFLQLCFIFTDPDGRELREGEREREREREKVV